jgi:hypothetical protein
MDPTAQLKALGIRTTADIAGNRQLSADVIRASDQRILDGYLARQQRNVVDPDFKQAEQAAYDQTYSALNNRPDEIFDDRLKSNQFINGRDFGQIDPHQAGINRAIDDLRKVTPRPVAKSDFDSNLSRYGEFVGNIFDKLI